MSQHKSAEVSEADGLGALAGSCPVAIDPLLCKAAKAVSMS